MIHIRNKTLNGLSKSQNIINLDIFQIINYITIIFTLGNPTRHGKSPHFVELWISGKEIEFSKMSVVIIDARNVTTKSSYMGG